jgi:hypothetical protein
MKMTEPDFNNILKSVCNYQKKLLNLFINFKQKTK